MRQIAQLGVVVSLLMCGVAVLETSEHASAQRNAQDRELQAAVSSETALISSSVRQTTTALSLMLVNPAVRQLLGGSALTPAVRRGDLVDTAQSLATLERASLVPLTAACLDGADGRQLVCAPGARGAVFPQRLGRQFLALAGDSPGGAGSAPFASPVTGRRSVAFLAPVRLDGRTLGLVHLDMGVGATPGSGLVLHDLPNVRLRLGGLGQRPSSTLDAGHRALVAVLPMAVGGTHEPLTVTATDTRPDPDLVNAWSTGLLTLLASAIAGLLCSFAGIVASNRRVVRELSTDPLTGLRNHRALIERLPRVCQRASEDEPAYVWFFDLNGFKNYNDSFGHIAGDSLLARLGARLREAVEPRGTVYRLGGDEFCALITAQVEDPHALFLRAREALSEQGGAFAVTCAAGAVEIPRETTDPTHALRLADQHMYREKATGRGGAADLITSVLHVALAQRHPDLGEHCDDVADDVELLARTIGLDEESVGLIVKAGDLHDVGKLGIPDEIITKPGPLSELEWRFMKQHTIMGEQIIAAAGPSLDRIGPLVRSSHERWDGNGYPDGLAGEEIPLGARIITICDSLHAMLDERAYKPAMTLEDALAELRGCAGTQFDPHLVEVFHRLVSERAARAAAGGQPRDAPARAGQRARSARRPATVRR